MANRFKTVFLLGVLMGFFIIIGGIIGGLPGVTFAIVLAMIINFFSYWFSDKIVLAIYRAREVTEAENMELYRIVARLSQKAGIPMPRIYVIPSQSPNAFATGRNPSHAAVAASEGLLALVSSDELEGVMAHELTHVKNYDTLISAIAASIAGAIMIMATVARWMAILGTGGKGGSRNNTAGLLVMAVLAPFAAILIQMAISRSREYLADDGAAELTGNPGGLARALEKLTSHSRRIPLNAGPSTAHMFIVNPLSAQKIFSLFSTHPPTEKRVKRLKQKKVRDTGEDDAQDGSWTLLHDMCYLYYAVAAQAVFTLSPDERTRKQSSVALRYHAVVEKIVEWPANNVDIEELTRSVERVFLKDVGTKADLSERIDNTAASIKKHMPEEERHSLLEDLHYIVGVWSPDREADDKMIQKISRKIGLAGAIQ